MSYTYQWQRCDADGANCFDLVGEVASTYTLQAGDVGSTIRVAVSDGVRTIRSDPSAVIAISGGGGGTDGTVLWEGDFETENSAFTVEYDGIQQKAAGRVTLVASPVRQGSKAMRVELHAGDNNVVGSGMGERAEVLKGFDGFGGVGETNWQASSVRFDASYAEVPNQLWNYFLQWHPGGAGAQASTLCVYNGQLRLVLNGGTSVADKPFKQAVVDPAYTKGVWYDFVIKQHWHYDPSLGYFEVWMQKDGVVSKPVDHLVGATRYNTPEDVYMKFGFYRAPGASGTAIGWWDCNRVTDNFDDAIAAFPVWNA